MSRVPFRRVERRLSGGKALFTHASHSQRMATVRQRGTLPEQLVRAVARDLGLAYRTANRDLEGSPDLANRTKKWAVFVHGCYWHRHSRCPKATMPRTNRAFWSAKFARNVERDRLASRALRKRGFDVIVVWECEARNPDIVRKHLSQIGATRLHAPVPAGSKKVR
jgi:DNA mismatch endonuclease, patch repair protein